MCNLIEFSQGISAFIMYQIVSKWLITSTFDRCIILNTKNLLKNSLKILFRFSYFFTLKVCSTEHHWNMAEIRKFQSHTSTTNLKFCSFFFHILLTKEFCKLKHLIRERNYLFKKKIIWITMTYVKIQYKRLITFFFKN